MTTPHISVAVIGAAGRMGTAACAAVENEPGLRLVAQLDSQDQPLQFQGADVAVEFTVPESSFANVVQCVENGIHAVVGTTGWTPDKLDRLRGVCASHPEVGVLIAPNFAIGALLMMRFAEMAAPYFTSVEVVETHHPRKVDAPSGTAMRTAALIAAARDQAGCPAPPDATETDPSGSRGANVDGVHVHAVRLQGMVAHQEVLCGNTGELLTVRHDSFDRISFMPGVVRGIREVAKHPGVTVGLEHYLGW